MERIFNAVVALVFVGPVEQFDQLVAGEFHLPRDEAVFDLRQPDEGEDNQIVGGRGQAVFLRSFDDSPARDEFFLAIVVDFDPRTAGWFRR
jgi:hypothetical protein